MPNFVLRKQHLEEILVFCFNWKKRETEAHGKLMEISGDAAPTDKSCRDGFDVSRMVISVLKTHLALDSQKILKAYRFSDIPDEYSNQTTIIESYFHKTSIHEKDSKARKLAALTIETERRKNAIFAKVVKNIWKFSNGKFYCTHRILRELPLLITGCYDEFSMI